MASSVSCVRATSSRKRFERRVVRARPARLLDVAEQVGEPAFDRLQLAGRRGLARVLDAVDLVGERRDQRFQPRRQRGVVRPLGQCQSQRVDAQRQIGEHVAFRPGVADALNLVGERLHLGRQPPDRLVGGDVVDHAAQGDDRAFELAQGVGISFRHDQIDLLRQPGDRVGIADEVLRRCQSMQRVAHFAEPALDAGERPGVGAGLPVLGDAPGEL